MDFHFPHIEPILPPGHIETVWHHLGDKAADLKEKLPANHDLTASVILFGGDEILVETFGYAGPNLLLVNGKRNGNQVSAYVHQSCLQVVFAIVPSSGMKPKQQFGFVQPENDSSKEQR